MRGHVFVTQGDITRISAHVLVYSTDRMLSLGGQLTSAFEAHVEGFAKRYRALREDLRIGERKQRHLDAGDAFWLEVGDRDAGNDRRDAKRGVVVVVAAASGRERGERAYLAAEGALRCAAENLEWTGLPKPWLIALPTFLAGDGGARHDRLSVAEPQIEAAERFVRASDEIDVAFVPFTEANHQVWVSARRNVRRRLEDEESAGEGPKTMFVADPHPDLVRAVQRGECVVFVGSGMSTRSGLPSWQALIDELAHRLGEPNHTGRSDLDYLLDLAQWYRNEGLAPSIETMVQERFSARASGARPTLAQYLVASLSVRYFVTTNYDDLLEVALTALRRHPRSIVREDEVSSTGSHDSCYVVKFHGCAVGGGPVVMSRDDYDEFFRGRPAMALLLEGLLLNQSFLFVGYSLRDPDFRQLWTRIASMLRGTKRPAFATTFERPSPHAKRQWAGKGLQLIPVPGDDPTAQARALDRFLDRLCELASLHPHLFLADDVEVTRGDKLVQVRARLLSAAPDLVEACLQSMNAPRTEALALVDLIRFYASHGWRGTFPGQLGAAFAALSLNRELTPTEQRELILNALRFTESTDEVRGLEARLAHFDDDD